MRRLVQAAKEGDTAAFTALYEAYYRSLYKAAYYILGNAHDAEDTVMETVADAFASLAALRADDAFDGWLFRILYNKARRKRGVLHFRAAAELDENLSDGGSVEQVGERADLMAALDTLSREERAIVVLTVAEGYTSQQVGGMLGLNPNTVRSKQMRALKKLRAKLEKE